MDKTNTILLISDFFFISNSTLTTKTEVVSHISDVSAVNPGEYIISGVISAQTESSSGNNYSLLKSLKKILTFSGFNAFIF